jgi:hypothetical protein
VGGDARRERASTDVIVERSCTCFLQLSQKRLVSDGFIVRQSAPQGDAMGISVARIHEERGAARDLTAPERVTRDLGPGGGKDRLHRVVPSSTRALGGGAVAMTVIPMRQMGTPTSSRGVGVCLSTTQSHPIAKLI